MAGNGVRAGVTHIDAERETAGIRYREAAAYFEPGRKEHGTNVTREVRWYEVHGFD
jgi:hypothetical protein